MNATSVALSITARKNIPIKTYNNIKTTRIKLHVTCISVSLLAYGKTT